MAPLAKIEVVIDGHQVPSRAIPLHRSRRHRLHRPGDARAGVTTATSGRLLFNDRASLSMLIAVMPEDKVSSLVTGLRRLLEGRHVIFYVTQIRGVQDQRAALRGPTQPHR